MRILLSLLNHVCLQSLHVYRGFTTPSSQLPFIYQKLNILRKSLQTTILDLLKMVESSPKEWKTLGKKTKKFLITSNFSFSHNVSERQYCRHLKTRACVGKGSGLGELLGSMNVCCLFTFWFLAPLADRQRTYVMARCPSCVYASVHLSVNQCINFFQTSLKLRFKF